MYSKADFNMNQKIFNEAAVFGMGLYNVEHG